MTLPFAALGRRGEVGRLRVLAREVLGAYGVVPAGIRLLRHEQNTTFRVDTPRERLVLRISGPGIRSLATVGSEMAWLQALTEETDVGVPAPVAALDGSLAVLAMAPGVPEARTCVLLNWLDGRFVDRRLTPAHLALVGGLIARLEEHATRWTPPAGFVRPRVDTLTGDAKLASMAGPSPGIPSDDDVRHAVELVRVLVSRADSLIVERAVDIARESTDELAHVPDSSGLIHGDLHQENYLFAGGEARAIDFDDCGRGFLMYDLAVPLWELEGRPVHAACRAALLASYGRSRPLPAHPERHLAAFSVLRRLQILLWVIESRDQAAFRDDWVRWSRKELDGIVAALAPRGGAVHNGLAG